MIRIARLLPAAALAVVLLPATLAIRPAGAHSGGRAQLYVDTVRLEPQGDGWRAALVLRDADSGRPEPGFGVQVTASGSGSQTVGPVALADPAAEGRYSATLPLTDGGWTLTVHATEIPGGPQAVPFTRAWPVTVQAGQALDVGSPSPGTRRHRGGGLPVLPLAVGLTAVALAVLARRRRPLHFS